MECWASILGDCGEGQSGEHYISDGIFDGEAITVRGFPWCREPLKMGIGSARSKILCSKHNWALSPFDGEAAKLSKFILENLHLQPLAARRKCMNGIFLEKWALKTFFNLGYLRGFHGGEQPNRFNPPEGLVRYLYCNEPIADGV